MRNFLLIPFSTQQLAISADKREFTRFLYDAMMFDMLPYWSPVAAVALLVAALFFAIKVCCHILIISCTVRIFLLAYQGA